MSEGSLWQRIKGVIGSNKMVCLTLCLITSLITSSCIKEPEYKSGDIVYRVTNGEKGQIVRLVKELLGVEYYVRFSSSTEEVLVKPFEIARNQKQ